MSSVDPQIFPAIFDISLLYVYLDEMSTGGKKIPPIEKQRYFVTRSLPASLNAFCTVVLTLNLPDKCLSNKP